MADATRIEWTDATWNPITGCTLVSDGCRNCYAAELAATRLRNHPSRKGLARRNADGVAKFTGEVRFNEGWLDQPLSWRKPRRIFVCAHGDLFHEAVPDEWIDRVFAVMALCPQHVFQVLTKRPERARAYLRLRSFRRVEDIAIDRAVNEPIGRVLLAPSVDPALAPPGVRVELARWPLPNVWLGTSIEDQETADLRIPYLLTTPAAVRFVSAEPLLGPVNLAKVATYFVQAQMHATDALLGGIWFHPFLGNPTGPISNVEHLDWVIVGGESGRNARPMDPDWARSLRDQCREAGVAFFMKQMAQKAEIPADLMIREWP